MTGVQTCALRSRSMGSRCMGFSSCGSWALERRLGSCGTRASLFRSMWDLPGPGLEPMSPALAGRFSTTAPPVKSLNTTLVEGADKRRERRSREAKKENRQGQSIICLSIGQSDFEVPSINKCLRHLCPDRKSTRLNSSH